MMNKNIFIVKYENENAWTEVLMKFLANSNIGVLNNFFKTLKLGIHVRNMDKVVFEMQKHEPESVPDATISLGSDFIVHIEVKKGEGFNRKQCQKHAKALIEKVGTYRTKALLLLTSDYSEPHGFKLLAEKYASKPIKIRHISWHDIDRFVKEVALSVRNVKVRFLADNFIDFLKEEVKPMMEWSGFESDFLDKWQDYYRFRQEINKLVLQILRSRLKEYCAERHNEYMEKEPKVERIGRTSVGYLIWKKRNSWIKVSGGFWGEDDGLTSPSIYLAWRWSWNVDSKIRESKKFGNMKDRLTAKKFYFADNYLGRDLLVREIYRLKADQQRDKIRHFIDSTTKEIEDSGLLNLLKKV